MRPGRNHRTAGVRLDTAVIADFPCQTDGRYEKGRRTGEPLTHGQTGAQREREREDEMKESYQGIRKRLD
jgi:hypothetical protein